MSSVPALTVAPRRSDLVTFGGFTVDTGDHTLWLNDRRVPLGPRAFALLRYLLEHRDRPVGSAELMDKVWRGVVVEENNLQVQVHAIRRLLGAAAIATVPGRGYRFMLPVDGDGDTATAAEAAATADEDAPAPADAARGGNLPARSPAIYGREGEREALRDSVRRRPLVSIVGAAGIGKTALAQSVAHDLANEHADGVWVIELASLTDPRLLVQTVARTVQLAVAGSRETADDLAAAMRNLRALLVFDNCEHLVDEMGSLVAALLRDSTTLHVLTTSQEPLRLVDEHVYRLAPLPVPVDARVDDPESYGAVRLLAERTRALLPRFAVDAATLPAIVDICRRLDGLPLAIELAAARVPTLGVDGVRERLEHRFRLLTGGSRLAPRRHQTLRAALDWSHGLLGEEERAVYRRLGLFVGSFSLESAQQLAADDEIDEWAALEALNSLVDKSLVLAEGAVRPRYRLLESTREHALQQLAEAGETDAWMALHAHAIVAALRGAIRARQTQQVLAEIGNVRIAYAWAREAGDRETAIALATLPAMVLAVAGAVDEARERLVDVEPLVDDATPPALAAQYWQWYGRIGLGGRLPASRVFQAFRRAAAMYTALGNRRHVHACHRHLAEALLDVGDVDGARACLREAEALEDAEWPVADVMRRLRVEGLCLTQLRQYEEALRISAHALEMARGAGIQRYEVVLLEDVARVHLQSSDAAEAARRYRDLAERVRPMQNGGFVLAKALTGLIAALTAADDLEAAAEQLRDSVATIARSGNVVAYVDVFASLAVRRGDLALGARLAAASDRFHRDAETRRDPVMQGCRQHVAGWLADRADARLLREWKREGEAMSEGDVLQAMGGSVGLVR